MFSIVFLNELGNILLFKINYNLLFRLFNFQEECYQSHDTRIISILSDADPLLKIINNNDCTTVDEEISKLYEPITVKVKRNFLTPQGRDNKSSAEHNTDLLKIEDHLKINFQASKQFCNLLFPLDEELNNNINIEKDVTSPTLKTTISANLITTKKKKKVLLHHKNLSNNEKSPQEINTENILQQKTSDLHPKLVKNIQIKNKNKLRKTLTQERIPNMFSKSSMIFQTSKKKVAYHPIALKSIACCNDLTQR